MATVKMTPNVVTQIIAKVRELHEADRQKISNEVGKAPPELGAEFYSMVVPLENQKKIKELMPEGVVAHPGCVSVRIMPHGVPAKWSPVIYTTVPPEAMLMPWYITHENIPGTEKVHWDGATVNVNLAEDWSALAAPKSREYIKKLTDFANKHNDVTKKAKEASDTMRLFLEQHKTVQSAMKEFGPALKAYIDPWLQQQLDAPNPKRVVKPKVVKEKVEVNVAKLVAKATVNQLNIN